jgi:molybdenum cofactor synthesis domain-containing protein
MFITPLRPVNYCPARLAAIRFGNYLPVPIRSFSMTEKNQIVTAAMLAIGDELLSGRTKDKNIGHLADILTAVGIDLEEVRIVPDEQNRIVEALNALRQRYDYVFTSGGIGPTHDDITADAVSRAFEVPCEHDARALKIMGENYASRGIEFTESRQRMARMPRGAVHIDNPVSTAPGFNIGNVYVMAGVPSIFQAMLDNVVPTLKVGTQLLSQSVNCPFGEGAIAVPLGKIQSDNPDTIIGSYPKYENGRFSTELVVRAREIDKLTSAITAVNAMITNLEASQLPR